MILKTNEKSGLDMHKSNIHPEVGQLLVEQMANELYNKMLYEEFASFYAEHGLVHLEKYFHSRAEEEEEHYQWIKKFLTDSDYTYSHPEVDKIIENYKDLKEPFQISMDVEVTTTEDIYAIYDRAVEEKDWITVQWLMSDDSTYGNLIKEQAEEMSLSRTVLEIAEMEDGWLNKERAIANIYNSR